MSELFQKLKDLPFTEHYLTREGLIKNAANFVNRTKDLTPKYIFDVGGNFGLYACAFALLHPDSIIHSFEPYPENFKYLTEHTKIFPNIHCHQVALWSKCTTKLMSFPPNREQRNTGLFSLTIKNGILPIPVETTTINKFYVDEGIIPDLLKIDAEGAEEEILIGASNILTSIKCVIVEKNANSSVVEKLLQNYFTCKYEDKNDQFWFNKS